MATVWGRPSCTTPVVVWFGRTWSGLHKAVTPTPSYILGAEMNVDCGPDLITQHQRRTHFGLNGSKSLQSCTKPYLKSGGCDSSILTFMFFKSNVKQWHTGVMCWPCRVQRLKEYGIKAISGHQSLCSSSGSFNAHHGFLREHLSALIRINLLFDLNM